jgi:hypothetical protein
MIEAKCSFNSINKVLIMISLIVLPIVLIITVFYFLNLKQTHVNNINKYEETFQTNCIDRKVCPCNTNGQNGEHNDNCPELKSGEKYCDETIHDYTPIRNIPSLQQINYKTPNMKDHQNANDDSCMFGPNYTLYSDSKPKTSRSCQVYFTDNQSQCDTDKESDPNNTCKFVFPSTWFEFNSVAESESSTPLVYDKKHIGSSGNNITTGNFGSENYSLVTKCYKESGGDDNDENTQYEFNINDIVRKDCSGMYMTDASTTKANTFSVDRKPSKNYASIKFDVYNGTQLKSNSDIYNNVLKSACSIEYPKLSYLANDKLKYFKFSLDSWDNINSIELVKLNPAQTAFESEAFSVNSLTSSEAYGLAYESRVNKTFKFKIFKNTTFTPKTIEIFKFTYNYLCGDKIKKDSDNDTSIISSPIIKFTKQFGKLDILHLFTIQGLDRSVVIEKTFEDLDDSFFDEFIFVESNKVDYKDEIQFKLEEEINNVKKDLKAEYEKLSGVVLEDIGGIDNTIETKRQALKTYSESLNFERVNNEFAYYQGYYDELNQTPYQFETAETVKVKRKLIPGLSVKKYQGYYNDRGAFFDNPGTPLFEQKGGIMIINGLNSASGTLNQAPFGDPGYIHSAASQTNRKGGEYYTYEWTGYFFPKIDGKYSFATWSDDASHLFIEVNGTWSTTARYDDPSVQGNLVVNNGGLHGWNGVRSSWYRLQRNKLYKIRLIFGENWGGDNIGFGWMHESMTHRWSHDGTGWFFSDVDGGGVIETPVEETTIVLNNKVDYYYYAFTDGYSQDIPTEYEMTVEEDGEYEMLLVGGGGGGGIDGGGGGGGGEVKFYTNRNVNWSSGPAIVLEKGTTYVIRVGMGGNNALSLYQNGTDGGITTIHKKSGSGVTELYRAGGGGGGGSKQLPFWPYYTSGAGNKGTGGGQGGHGHNWYFHAPHPVPTGDGSISGNAWGYGGSAGGTGTSQGVSTNAYDRAWVEAGIAAGAKEINITGVPVLYGGGGAGGTWTCMQRASQGTEPGGDGGACWFGGGDAGDTSTGSGGGGGGNYWWTPFGGKGGAGMVIIRKNISLIDDVNEIPNMDILESVMLSGGNLIKHPKFSLKQASETKKINGENITISTKESSVWVGDNNNARAWKLFNGDTTGYQNSTRHRRDEFNWFASREGYSGGLALAQRTYFPGYAGEYVMINLGYKINLHSVRFYVRSNLAQRAPGEFKIYATNHISRGWNSVDYSKWTEIHFQSQQLTVNDYRTNNRGYAEATINNNPNNIEYQCYALVVNKIAGYRSGLPHLEYLNFNEWQLYERPVVETNDYNLSAYRNHFAEKYGSSFGDNYTNLTSSLSWRPYNNIRTSSYEIKVGAGNTFKYKIHTFMFLQKGYYKFKVKLRGKETTDNIAYMSEFYIIFHKQKDTNKYLLTSVYSEITSITNSEPVFNYIMYSPNKYLYIETSGFYQVYFKCYGFNYKTTNITFQVDINYDYKSFGVSYNDAYTIDSIKSSRFPFLREELSRNQLETISSTVNGSSPKNSNYFPFCYRNAINTGNYYDKIYNSDLYTDTTNFKSDFTTVVNYKKSSLTYNTQPLESDKTTLNTFKSDMEKYYLMRMDEIAVDSSFRYPNPTDTVSIHPKIANLKNYKEIISSIDYPVEISKGTTPLPKPCLKNNLNIFEVIKKITGEEFTTSERDNLKTIEKFPLTQLQSSGALPSNAPKSLYIQFFTS